MHKYWGLVVAEQDKFVIQELKEYKEQDNVADFESDGYCLIEMPPRYLKCIKTDYMIKPTESGERKTWVKRGVE